MKAIGQELDVDGMLIKPFSAKDIKTQSEWNPQKIQFCEVWFAVAVFYFIDEQSGGVTSYIYGGDYHFWNYIND